jgi:hypothetical protein
MAPICCPETSVNHCHYTLRNFSEEQKSSEALPIASVFRDLLCGFTVMLDVLMSVIMYEVIMYEVIMTLNSTGNMPACYFLKGAESFLRS